MRFDRVRPKLVGDVPFFQERAVQLAAGLRRLSQEKLGALMGISPALAKVNVARFKGFAATPDDTDGDAAILAYQGDTYIGFAAKTLSDADLRWAQTHLGILSGLYGLVQPLDAIQPYRLEMGTKLGLGKHKDLYALWRPLLTAHVAEIVKKQKLKAVVGCASQEYLSAIETDALGVPFIQCEFREMRNGKAQVIGLLAKRARGMMARYVVQHRITDPKLLQKFDSDGYRLDKKSSTETQLIFVR